MKRTIAEALKEEGNPLRQDLQDMKRTIADAMKKQGRREGAVHALQQTLLRLLRIRFEEIPEEIAATIEACRDVKQLNAWLDRTVIAKTLAGLRIRPTS